jgi:hypothetical protein
MTAITHSLPKSAMCLQTQAWSRGFATVNSIPGSPGSFVAEKIPRI